VSAPTFIQAVQETFGSIAGSRGVPETLWTEQIPEQDNTIYPRIQFDQLGDTPISDVDGEQMTTARGRFTVFAESLITVEDLLGENGIVRGAFGPTSLSIDGKRNRLWRGSYQTGIAAERTRTGMPIYVGTLEHTCEIF
jgi:hypothetical protein